MNTRIRRASRPSVLSALAVGAFLACASLPALAQRLTLEDLQAQITALRSQVSSQAAQITTLQYDLAAVKANSVLALDRKLTYDVDSQTALFKGINVQVTNGAGLGVVNGRGNLIVGHSTARVIAGPICSNGAFDNQGDCEATGGLWAVDHKSGSHNLVVGYGNAYSAYGGVVFGALNAVTANYSTVTGGIVNVARGANVRIASFLSGAYGSVGGGSDNTSSGESSSVSGGNSNIASGTLSTVSGGTNNHASGDAGSVCGGQNNVASGMLSSVNGGVANSASGYLSSVSGGRHNTASGAFSSASGGNGNAAIGSASSVSGGQGRSAPSPSSWAAGGLLQVY